MLFHGALEPFCRPNGRNDFSIINQQTDRRRDDRFTNKQTDGQTNKHMDRQTNRHLDRQPDRMVDSQRCRTESIFPQPQFLSSFPHKDGLEIDG